MRVFHQVLAPQNRPDFAICLACKEHPGLGLLAGEPFIDEYTQQSLGELAGDSGVQKLSWGLGLAPSFVTKGCFSPQAFGSPSSSAVSPHVDLEGCDCADRWEPLAPGVPGLRAFCSVRAEKEPDTGRVRAREPPSSLPAGLPGTGQGYVSRWSSAAGRSMPSRAWLLPEL